MSRLRLDDPDLPLADLMRAWPQTIPVFVRHKMLCVGCLISPLHTVTDACAEYHLKEEDFLAELRQAAKRA
jgi:hybrid cluster-associated redox disulfide protein